MKTNFTYLRPCGSKYSLVRSCLSKIKFIVLLIFLIAGIQLSYGQISRDQVISNAQTYMSYQWTATSSNIKSGTSCGGKTIQTPSWVKVGTNTAMPYCWGGWTTTASIQGYLNTGKSAGDNNTATSFGAEPSCAVGLDCSGFITRVWGITNTKYSTSTLENISKVINLTSVQPGDILNDAGSHVRLVEINNGNGSYQVIESSGRDWKVSRYTYTAAQLSGNYIPRQYNNITGGTLSGYASVSQGITISPSPLISGNNFTASFTLKETKGTSITFESIICAILKSDNTFLRDMEIKGPITIAANGTYTYSSTLQWLSTAAVGSYTAVARGKVTGGDWFDFSVNGGTSPKGFQVTSPPTPGSLTLSLTPNCSGTTSQIILNWTASTNVATYDIYRDGVLYPAGTGLTGTTFTNTGTNVVGGTTYQYYIKAKNTAGSTNSNTISATAPNCSPTPTIIVTSPNGGENWQAGSTQIITWTSTGVTGTVQIQPYLNGVPQTNIAASASNSGSYSWSIPSNYTPGTTYKIGISAMSGTVADLSNSYFTISSSPTITVTSPNGGENWQAGTTQTITWSSIGVTGAVQIQPYLNGVPQTNIAASASNTGSYSWSIPSNYTPGTTYKIGISAMSGTVADLSNSNFIINAPTSTLTVTPTSLILGSASGSNGQINVSSNVSWTASDDASWLSISPTSGSNNGTVTVTSASENTSSSTQSGTVTISGSGITRTVTVTQNGATQSITVTSPNGLENWQAGTTQTITWTSSSGVTGIVQIQPYLNGVAQTNIAPSVPNTGSYSWSIPSNYPPGTTYKIGISAMSGTVADLSNSNFTIIAPVNTDCTAPSAIVNDKSGLSPLSMTCVASGGSGGNYAYKWYSGSSCTGTVLGTSSSLNVTTSGSYSCKVYINGFESTCYTCSSGNANISSSQETTICSWKYKSSMPIGRNSAASASSGNYIYIFGGDYGRSFYQYDAINDNFITKALMPGGTDESQAAVLGNKIYLCHGFSDEYVRIYDIPTDTWVTKSQRPIGVYGRGSVFKTVNNYLYAIGGGDGNLNPSSQLDRYDPANDTWSTINNPMPTARCFATAVVYNNLIYVIGGRTSSGISNSVEVYDPTSNSWTTKAPMPVMRSSAIAELVNGKIYIIGGFTGSSASNSIEEYNIATNSWSTINLTPSFLNVLNAASGVVNDKIYVIGGVAQSGATLASTEELSFCAVTNYTIITSSIPLEGGATSGGGTYQSGQSRTVTATANSGYTFSNWSENGTPVSTNASYTFTLSGNRSLVANFVTTSSCTAPTTQTSGIFFDMVGPNSMRIYFNTGNGEKRIVKINTTNNFINPVNGTDPVANSNYSGSGEQVVDNGALYGVEVTGLSANTTYYFRIYEYNCSNNSTVFLSTPGVNNPNSKTTSDPCPGSIAPTNLSPGATSSPGPGLTSNPTFIWTPTGAAWYNVEIRKEPFGLIDGIASGCTSTPLLSFPSLDLQNGKTYRWNVIASSSCYSGCLTASPYYYFTYNSCIAPTIATNSISSITSSSVISGGNVTTDGGASVTVRGVCWSNTVNPTIDLTTKTSDGTGTGTFTSSITGLTAGTTYHVRAYATNSAGTGYGNDHIFTTPTALPISNAGADQSVNEGAVVTLDGSTSSVSSGKTITYKWTAPPGITLSSTTVAKPTFTAPQVTVNTDYTFSLVVNDGTADSPADQVVVSVKNVVVTTHFTPIWTGKGFDHMNIYIYSAKLDGVDLAPGDEIGIFDGTICVGVGTLTVTITSIKTLDIAVSRNDGSGNGYTAGNAISFKFFDSSTNMEMPNVTAVYATTDPSWSMDGKFAVGASAFAELTGLTKVSQDIAIDIGWNIISAYVVPSNLEMKTIFQPMIDAGTLKKVMDESGKTIENFGAFGGWKNNIGNLNSTKGYKVNVLSNSTLSLEGTPVLLPLDIALATGWNIISYPSATAQDAKALVQSLIDAGKLKKVMDEAGKTIENFGAFGGWKNNIGNFLPGKGYKVNVLEDCILTIPANGTKAATIVPEVLASTHFIKAFTGNGTDHASINLVNLQASGLRVGDEIGVFDGKLCVGSATIGSEQMMDGSISIPASANDGMGEKVNGFISEHTIELQLFRQGQTYQLSLTKLGANEWFEKNESLFVQANTSNLTAIQIADNSAQFKCFPNPFTHEITIEVQNLSQAEITVEIYNMAGQLITTLFKGTNPGNLVVKWNGTNDLGEQVASGVYLCKVNGLSKQVIFEGGKGNSK